MLKNFTHNLSDLPVCSASDPRADSSTPDIIDAVATESSDPPRFAIVPPLVVSTRTTAPTAPRRSFEPQHHSSPPRPPRLASPPNPPRRASSDRFDRRAPHHPRTPRVDVQSVHRPSHASPSSPSFIHHPAFAFAFAFIIHAFASIPDRSRRLRGRPRVCCAHMTFDDRFHAYHTTYMEM